MFFIGIFGTDSDVRSVEGSLSAKCKACGKPVFMSVCKKYNYVHAFFIPVFKYHKEYICTCPCCASVLLLDEDKAKLLEQTGNCVAPEQSFRILKDNHAGRCPQCGHRNVTTANFCQNCGAAL